MGKTRALEDIEALGPLRAAEAMVGILEMEDQQELPLNYEGRAVGRNGGSIYKSRAGRYSIYAIENSEYDFGNRVEETVDRDGII